jgi:fermentation-respiration switch protein FrsA (DUF1100 family)
VIDSGLARTVLFFVAIIGALYLALVVYLYVIQERILYHPNLIRPRLQEWGAADMAEVTLKTADGLELNAWYKPAREGRPTILHFHGNAGHIGGRGRKLSPYREAGFGLLLVDYRGYGGNAGTPSEQGLYHDGRAALAFLTASGVPASRIVLYGESLGSGVATQMARELAEKEPVAALILEAPFSAAGDVGAYHYPYIPVRTLLRDRFASIEKIAQVKTPVMIVHGEDDRTIPVVLGRNLFAAAREPKQGQWIPQAGHVNL